MSIRSVTGRGPDRDEPSRASRRRRRRPGPADVRQLLREEAARDAVGDTDPGSGPNGGAGRVHAQPILDLASGSVSGYEALARFPELPGCGPQDWFAAAHRAGIGAQLEARAIIQALRLGATRPPGTVLSVNVSPNVIDAPVLQAALPTDLTGLQFEVTEHQLAHDGEAVLRALDGLRRRGARIAIDDVGVGYAGFKRLMAIRPDVLKLDRDLVVGVSTDPRKVALVEAIVLFAARTGARVCAEGLETVEDLTTVVELDVALGQGWVIGRPSASFGAATDEAARAVSTNRGRASSPPCSGPDPVAHRPFRNLTEALEALTEVTTIGQTVALLAATADVLGCDEVRLALLDPAGPSGSVPRSALAHPGDGAALIGGEHLTTDQPVLRFLPAAPTPPGTRPAEPEGGSGVWPLRDAPSARRAVVERVVAQVLPGTVAVGAAEARLLAAAGARSLVLFPVVAAGHPIGVLGCLRRNGDPWSRAELRPARALAAATGPAVAALPVDQ